VIRLQPDESTLRIQGEASREGAYLPQDAGVRSGQHAHQRHACSDQPPAARSVSDMPRRAWAVPRGWSRLLWPTIITCSAVGSVLATLVEPMQPLRPVLAFWFLLVCPGMAFVRLLGLSDSLAECALAVALSLALDTLVGEALLFAGAWSPAWGLAALVALSIGGAAIQVGRSAGLAPGAVVPCNAGPRP
jgi:hypothetical protein